MKARAEALYLWILSKRGRPLTLGLLVGFAVCFGLFQLRSNSIPDPLDATFPYGASEMHAFLNRIGPEKAQLYAWTQVTLDFAFPVCYAGLLALWAATLKPSWATILVSVSLAAGIADVCENLLLAGMSWTMTTDAAPWACIFTGLKFTMIVVALLGNLVGTLCGRAVS